MNKPDYLTLISDDAWSKMPVYERAMRIVRFFVDAKVREELGPNHGKWVDKILASVGSKPGFAYCASSVYYAMINAGADPRQLPEKRSAAGVISWYQWANQKGMLYGVPKRGFLFYWLDGQHGHIGFVREVGNGWFKTLEGNTNADGSRDGDGFYEKVRYISYLKEKHDRFGFIDVTGVGEAK